ncbi:MAG: siderophore-interacting protein [Rhodospirillales bacterium]|nr:siderophore-interacting protein [Rhodospirillales bacterium]
MVNVARAERLTERLTSVTFRGDRLADFGPPKPGGHIKLLFLPDGVTWNPDDPKDETPRPPSRTYTPRRYDRDACELEVEFVHHGEGLASNWAQTAKPGDPMFIGGPCGGYDIPEDIKNLVLVADETSMPAAGMILEALPDGRQVEILCEVTDQKDERDLSPIINCSPTWLHRAEEGVRQGVLLERAVQEIAAAHETRHWWIACESATMRRIRDHLLKECSAEPSRLHTRGYWKLGEANYPDHDYGND